MIDPKTCDHLYAAASSRRDPNNPDDETYPIIVCGLCMTRWHGHRERSMTTPPSDALISSAARDALLLGQDHRAIRMIKEELGLLEEDRTRPNCMVGMISGLVPSNGQATIASRPCFRSEEFVVPTHFIVDHVCSQSFEIVGMTVGNRSLFLNYTPIPAVAFSCAVVMGWEVITISPGTSINTATVEISGNIRNVDLSDHAVNPERMQCRSSMDLTITAHNISVNAESFRGWFLGRLEKDR